MNNGLPLSLVQVAIISIDIVQKFHLTLANHVSCCKWLPSILFVFHLWLSAAIALSLLLLSADVRKLCVSEGRARSPHQIVEVAAASVSEIHVDVMALPASIHVILVCRSEWGTSFHFLAVEAITCLSYVCGTSFRPIGKGIMTASVIAIRPMQCY